MAALLIAPIAMPHVRSGRTSDSGCARHAKFSGPKYAPERERMARHSGPNPNRVSSAMFPVRRNAPRRRPQAPLTLLHPPALETQWVALFAT